MSGIPPFLKKGGTTLQTWSEKNHAKIQSSFGDKFSFEWEVYIVKPPPLFPL